MKKIYRFLTLVLTTFFLASCNMMPTTGNNGEQTDDTVHVTGVSFSEHSITLNEGEDRLLTYEITPSNATNKHVSFKSYNNSIAVMNSEGYVIAVNEGSTKVKVTTEDGKYFDECSVTVNKVGIHIDVTSVNILNKIERLEIGTTHQLETNVSPDNATNKGLTFSSSDSQVATISDSGLITALGIGNTTIEVTSKDNVNIYDSLHLNVYTNEPEFNSVSLGSSFTMEINTTKQLEPVYKLGRKVVTPTNTNPYYYTNNEEVATVTSDTGLVTAVGVGHAIITLSDTGCISSINVTVEDNSGPDYDIAVGTNLNYSGSLTVGAPLAQRTFMTSLLSDFNEKTNSNIRFTVVTFEEDNGASGYGSASSMPAILPYTSDQTLNLYQFDALSAVSENDSNWIQANMSDSAYNAAEYNSILGYPYAADNGVVMFYNGNYCNEEQIDTLDELFALAEQNDMEVNFAIGNGFYAAGALMTYSGGNSLYNLTPSGASYNASSNFNSAAGLKGAKLIRQIANNVCLRNATAVPVRDVLATIVSASKAQEFKAAYATSSGKYAVSPLPYVDKNKTTRLGSFLGYKFYGINNTLTVNMKTIAADVAKFLSSEYSQVKRFDEYGTRPTLNSLAQYVSEDSLVKALNKQEQDKSTILLKAVASELWSGVSEATYQIKNLPNDATDNQYLNILAVLDSACQMNN